MLTRVSPRARPGASLRLFEVSLRALICLPLAACFTRQFLVDSLLTASLQPRPRRQRRFPGRQAGCGQRGQAGSTWGPHPCIPPGAGIPVPGGETWLRPAGLSSTGLTPSPAPRARQPLSFGCRGGRSAMPQVLQFFLVPRCAWQDGGKQCSARPKSSQELVLAPLTFSVQQQPSPRSPGASPGRRPLSQGPFLRPPLALQSRASCAHPCTSVPCSQRGYGGLCWEHSH